MKRVLLVPTMAVWAVGLLAACGRTELEPWLAGPQGAPDAAPPLLLEIRLQATVTQPDVVQLSWNVFSNGSSNASGNAPGDPASGFAVLRDGERVAVVAPGARAYADADAAPGEVSAPSALSATRGTRASGVLLSWSPSKTSAGRTHVYQVLGLVDGGGGAIASNLAEGARAVPALRGYEISRDDGRTWTFSGAATTFDDAGAPLGLLSGDIEALPRFPRPYVRLRVLAEPTFTPVPATYRVRAAVEGRSPSPPSDQTLGYRAAGDVIAYAWQRSASDDEVGFADLPDVTGAVWFDGKAPIGAGRYYRAVLRAEGAEGVTPAARAEQVGLTRLSGGSFQTCGLRSDGKRICWGQNYSGAGDEQVSADSFKMLSAGVFAGCGVRTDDKIVCWGNPDDHETPDVTPTAEGYLSVGIGIDRGCGLRLDGTLVCWGCCGKGKSPPPGVFKSLSVGGTHACALREDNRAVCWGANRAGESTGEPSADTFAQVSAGWGHHSCGVRWDGSVVCWGENGSGQASPTPSPVRFKSVRAGVWHTCGLQTDGRLVCWGKTELPWAPPGPSDERYLDVAVGYEHTCVLREGGDVRCWGSGKLGQAPSSPRTERFKRVSVGTTGIDSFTCGIRTDDKLICWGNNDYGGAPPGPSAEAYADVEAGYYGSCTLSLDGLAQCQGLPYVDPTPQAVAAEPLTTISVGSQWGCGTRRDGTILCWGGDRPDRPLPPSPPQGAFTSVSVGDGHACGLRTDGRAVCWGNNVLGQAPTEPSVDLFTSVTAGRYHACGLRSDSTLACWGGRYTMFGGPPPPFPTDRFESIHAGDESVCGVRLDHRLHCWVPSADKSLGPFDAPSLDRFKSVSTGTRRFCAVRADDRLLCWGGAQGL